MRQKFAAVLLVLGLFQGCDEPKPEVVKQPAPPAPPAKGDVKPEPPKRPSLPAPPDKLEYGKLAWEIPTAEQHRSVLKNGMIVYAIEDRSLPKTDLSIFIRAGSFWEPKGKEGLASMTGSVMRTGGTEKTAPEALDERLEFLAIQLGVSIGDTQAGANLGVLTKDLDEGLATLAEVDRKSVV